MSKTMKALYPFKEETLQKLRSNISRTNEMLQQVASTVLMYGDCPNHMQLLVSLLLILSTLAVRTTRCTIASISSTRRRSRGRLCDGLTPQTLHTVMGWPRQSVAKKQAPGLSRVPNFLPGDPLRILYCGCTVVVSHALGCTKLFANIGLSLPIQLDVARLFSGMLHEFLVQPCTDPNKAPLSLTTCCNIARTSQPRELPISTLTIPMPLSRNITTGFYDR